MIYRLNRILFLFLLLLNIRLDAQQMNFSNISSRLTLPSEECYNILQDSKGYIWICTENGLCKYNGSTIKIFNQYNGLPEKGVYYIREDKAGIIHIITSKSRVLKIINDSIKEEGFTRSFAEATKKFELAYLFNKDENDDFLISTSSASYKISQADFKITKIKKNNPEQDANFIIVMREEQDYLIKNVPITTDNYYYTLLFVCGNKTKKIFLPHDQTIAFDWRVRVCESNGYTFFSIDHQLIRIDKQMNYTVYNFPARILSIYPDKEKGLWIGLFQEGLYYYKDVNKMEHPQICLRGYSVSGTIVDEEGAVWCTTLEKSVFYCNNPHVTSYLNIPELNKSATFLKSVNNKAWLSISSGSYISINENEVSLNNNSNSKSTEVTDVILYDDHLYFSSKGHLLRTDTNFRDLVFMNENVLYYQLDVFKDRLFGLSSTSLFEIKDNKSIRLPALFKARGKCMMCYNDSIVLIGTMDGFYKLNLNDNSFIKQPNINTPVTKIFRTHDGQIWITTKGEGLFILKNELAQKTELGNAVTSEILLDIAEDKYHVIWIASPDGLLKVERKETKLKTKLLSTFNGLISNNIKLITANDETLYVSTMEGLCSFPIRENLVNLVPPPVFIQSVKMKDSIIDHTTAPLIFNHNENSFSIIFDGLSYKNGSKAQLLYKFAGQDSDFKTTAQNELNFDNLTPDTYELIVYALNNDGLKSKEPVRFKFEIRKPFWWTDWFLTLCFLLAIVLIAIFTITTVRRIRRKEEEKTNIHKQITESQLSALQAQMNPHFIFNAINSIQNYILENEEEEAYNYLAKFSKLIRMVLDNSREKMLSLSSELAVLKLYVELEQLRFKNSFDFSLTVTDGLNEEEVKLPTMLVQPYVENAIWHGLMNLNKERKGFLKVMVSKQNDLLKITIEDNGIGRLRSQQYKKEDLHNPVAMKLTEERLLIIQKMLDNEDMKAVITDLYSDTGIACGTKVELFLPLMIL